MTIHMKQDWQLPTLEVLSIHVTMGGPNWCNPDANNDGHNNAVKCGSTLDPTS